MQDYVAGRIPTARLLDEAWAACQTAEKDGMRSGLLGQASETQSTKPNMPDLEELDDDEVNRLYHATLKKIAADSR